MKKISIILAIVLAITSLLVVPVSAGSTDVTNYVQVQSLSGLNDGDVVKIQNYGGGDQYLQWYLRNMNMHLKLASTPAAGYETFKVKKYATGVYAFYQTNPAVLMDGYFTSNLSDPNVDFGPLDPNDPNATRFTVAINSGLAIITDRNSGLQRDLRGDASVTVPFLRYGPDLPGSTDSRFWKIFKKVSYTATFTTDLQWNTGFNATITLANTGTTSINNWTLEFDFPYNITQAWNATIDSHVTTT